MTQLFRLAAKLSSRALHARRLLRKYIYAFEVRILGATLRSDCDVVYN